LLYTFDALTGKPTRGAELEGALEGTVVFEGKAQDAHLLIFEKGNLIIIVDENNKVCHTWTSVLKMTDVY